MKNITALRTERNQLALAIKQQLDESANANKFWGPEDQEKYNKQMADIDNIDLQIKNIQAFLEKTAEEQGEEKVISNFAKKVKDPKAREMYNRYIRGGEKAITNDEWFTIRNAMAEGAQSTGGYMVQTEVAAYLIDYLKLYGGMRNVATVIQTETGSPMNFPQTDGTAEYGELVAENTAAASADPTFGTVALNPYKFSSKVVTVPFELLQDSVIDIEAFINKRLTQRVGRIQNQLFTTGSGASQPYGVVTQSQAGKVGLSGQTVSVIFADLVDLLHSVDPAYRQLVGGNVGYMMSDSTLRTTRKLVDTNGRPIFLPAYEGLGIAMPDTLLGYPVYINQDMPAMAANAKSIIFGAFENYYIRDAMSATLFRFDDSAYAKNGQVGFLMWMRSGGNLLDVTSIKYYQNSAT